MLKEIIVWVAGALEFGDKILRVGTNCDRPVNRCRDEVLRARVGERTSEPEPDPEDTDGAKPEAP